MIKAKISGLYKKATDPDNQVLNLEVSVDQTEIENLSEEEVENLFSLDKECYLDFTPANQEESENKSESGNDEEPGLPGHPKKPTGN